MIEAPVIAIDGPSGAGKGTLCQLLAKELGWHLLDSGAIYRLCGLACIGQQLQLEPANEAEIAELAENLDIEFQVTDDGLKTFLQGAEVTKALRFETTGEAASKVAAMGQVRDALLQRQRAFAKAPGLVADGRDMGTVVFPLAPLKIYLTASSEERANRRYKQLQEAGESVNLATILKDIEARDARDMGRKVAPLKPAEDSVVIDSTDLSITEVLQAISQLVEKRGL